MVKRAVLLVLLLSLFFAQPVMAAEATGSGKINGVLVNKTAGGGSVADKVVSLEVIQDEKTVGVKTTRSDTAGNFTFTALPTDASYTYELAVTYQSVEYRTDLLSFNAGNDTLAAQINVFETSTDDRSLIVMLSHATVYFENSTLLVKEYYLLVNNSDRTYIGPEPLATGEPRQTLKFNLPEGATDVQSSFGLSTTTAILSGSNLIDSAPVKPTGRDVSFSYRLPYISPDYTLSWKVNYAINRFDLLLPEGTTTVTGDKLTKEQPLYIAGRSYQDYSGKAIAPGDVIVAKLSGLPVGVPGGSTPAAQPSPGQIATSPKDSAAPQTFNYAWLALIPLAIGAGFVLIRRKKAGAPVPVKVTARSEQNKLLADIAELDDRFEEGQLTEEEYSRRRAEKKRQLTKLLQ